MLVPEQASKLAGTNEMQNRIVENGLSVSPDAYGQLEDWMNRMREKIVTIQQQVQLSNMTGLSQNSLSARSLSLFDLLSLTLIHNTIHVHSAIRKRRRSASGIGAGGCCPSASPEHIGNGAQVDAPGVGA